MYIPNKDCSEYCEDYIKENGGSLVSLMFFEQDDTKRTLRMFKHRMKMDQVCESEIYVYHTVVLQRGDSGAVIDVTNDMHHTTLHSLAGAIYLSNNGFHTPHSMECYAVLGTVPDGIATWNDFISRIPQSKVMQLYLREPGETAEFD